MNECSIDNECHVNAQCANTDGSYTCSCLDGYAGAGRNCTGKYLCAAMVSLYGGPQGSNRTFFFKTKLHSRQTSN